MDAITKARKGRGMSQRTVAKAMQKSPATISRWESGKVAPTLSDFLLICWFYELEPMRFFVWAERFEKALAMFDGDLTSHVFNTGYEGQE